MNVLANVIDANTISTQHFRYVASANPGDVLTSVDANGNAVWSAGGGGGGVGWALQGINLYKTNSGNVGIGTGAAFAADSLLQVLGKIHGNLFQLTDGSQGVGKFLVDGDGFGNAVWQTLSIPVNYWTAAAGNTIFNNNGSGLGGVGIGTNGAPSTTLHVQKSSSGAVRIVDTTEGAGKVLTSDASGVGTWQTPAPAGSNYWSLDGSNNITKNTAGKVGINAAGTAFTPDVDALLQVVGQVRADAFRLTNGTQAAGHMLYSNSSGVATWAAPPAQANYWNIDGFNNINNNNVGKVAISENLAYTPSTTLHVKKTTAGGAVRIEDLTAGVGKVLTSDATGLGTWEPATTFVFTNGATATSVSNSLGAADNILLGAVSGSLTTAQGFAGHALNIPPWNAAKPALNNSIYVYKDGVSNLSGKPDNLNTSLWLSENDSVLGGTYSNCFFVTRGGLFNGNNANDTVLLGNSIVLSGVGYGNNSSTGPVSNSYAIGNNIFFGSQTGQAQRNLMMLGYNLSIRSDAPDKPTMCIGCGNVGMFMAVNVGSGTPANQGTLGLKSAEGIHLYTETGVLVDLSAPYIVSGGETGGIHYNQTFKLPYSAYEMRVGVNGTPGTGWTTTDTGNSGLTKGAVFTLPRLDAASFTNVSAVLTDANYNGSLLYNTATQQLMMRDNIGGVNHWGGVNRPTLLTTPERTALGTNMGNNQAFCGYMAYDTTLDQLFVRKLAAGVGTWVLVV